MRVTVLNRTVLPLPSASGLEIAGNRLYLIGDDSPFLYAINREKPGSLIRWPLFVTGDFGTGRLPKAMKPDLECLSLLTVNGIPHLLALGSGSNTKRDRGFLIRLPADESDSPEVTALDLHPLYEKLRSLPEITGTEGTLNLEGLAIDNNRVVLLNRSNKAGHNAVLVFDVTEFTGFLLGKQTAVPHPQQIHYFKLPNVSGVAAGFTGAFLADDQLFFTAAAEDTNDPILDGPVHGSFLGRWLLNESPAGLIVPDLGEIKLESGELFSGKVESLVVTEMEAENRCRALAVTDDDLGGSELLELQLEW